MNQDSLVEGSVARTIVETGEIDLPWTGGFTTTHSQSTPLYNVLLAFVGASLGVDSMFMIQWVVAAISMTVVLTVYLMLLSICADRKSALIGALFVCLFGTFLYMTASGWKISLGIALYTLLIYAYSQRQRRSMKVMVILLLFLLPFVHHLVAIVGYMTMAFLTGWSWVYALANGTARKRHFEDLVILLVFTLLAFGYYYAVSLDRLSYIGSSWGILVLLGSMLLFFFAATAILLQKSHSKLTFAPVPAAVILAVSFLDYNGYLFPYVPSTSFFNYFLIATASAFMLFLGWYGLEFIIESKSRYRAIPLGMLLPSLTLVFFAMISPSVEDKHQFVYRTFDFADPAIGVGIGLAFFAVFRRPRLKKVAPIVFALFLSLLIITLPYGLYTVETTGVKHDTQAYEIDAFDWLIAAYADGIPSVNSDERISYIAWTLYGLGKDNTLPGVLVKNRSLIPGVFNFYEESWSAEGVNDYPNGLAKPDRDFINRLMRVENVCYIGGPEDNRIIFIQHTWIGQIQNNWYYPYP